jgi:hypothetical protein
MTPTMADPNRSRHHNDNNNNNDDANDRFFRRLTFDQVYTRSFGLFMERLNLFLTIALCARRLARPSRGGKGFAQRLVGRCDRRCGLRLDRLFISSTTVRNAGGDCRTCGHRPSRGGILRGSDHHE